MPVTPRVSPVLAFKSMNVYPAPNRSFSSILIILVWLHVPQIIQHMEEVATTRHVLRATLLVIPALEDYLQNVFLVRKIIIQKTL
jgi:hypothetical protein